MFSDEIETDSQKQELAVEMKRAGVLEGTRP